MNEQEKFDDLLRSRLSEERDFPFDETNWDKAEGMIARSEKRRRYGIIAAIFFAGIVVGSLIMLPFVHTTNISSTTLTTPSPQQNTITANQNQDKTHIQSGTIPASANTTTVQQQPNQTAENNSITTNKRVTNSQPIASLNTAESKLKKNATVQSSDNSSTAKHHKHLHVNADSTQQYSYVRPVSKKTKKIRTLNDVANNNAAITKIRRQEYNNTKGSNSSKPTNPVEQNTSPTIHTTSTNTQANDTSNKTQPIALTANPVTKNDSGKTIMPPANTITQQQPQQDAKYIHTLLSIDAGAGYSLGWQKEGATQGSGGSPILGLSVTHYFSTNISARIGLQYNSFANLNTLYSVSSSQYDFGSTNSVTSITLKTLYYAALPIQFQYNISNNDIIGVGANVLYLINSNSNVVSYSQNYFGTSGYTSADKIGYMDGINNLDAQLTLAYRRKINRFTISVEGYYGLLDIENNSFFNNNVFERNSGLRAILSFDIIK
ncbi:MAG TPA: hypothetical protein VNY36_01880 [Bacteroidia bacterium]|jgi:hypothetical protein|nr:hypothetical protein [Bacteroidia bacterium]